MITTLGYHKKSEELIIQPGAPGLVNIVCLMHDTRHKQERWF